MDVLVTGSGGFIGQPLVRRLRELGYSVAEIRNRSDCDMSDLRAIEDRIAEVRPETTIHLAASADSGAMGTMIQSNTVMSVLNLVKAMRSKSSNVIHVGSYKQYGEVPLPFRESDQVNPVTHYGHSKHIAEELLRYSERLGVIRLTSLRLGPVFGPGQSSRSLVARLIDSCSGKNDGLQVGVKPWDPLYIDDAMDAIAAVLGSDRCVGGTFNVSGGVETNPLNFAELVGAEFGLPTELIRFKLAVSEGLGWSCLGDITRMTATTGWRPKWSHAEGVRQTVEAFKCSTMESGGLGY
jgi:GDP-4-dehydro-6-deoxy-D-mannose reductase